MAVNVPNVPGVPGVVFAAATVAVNFLTSDVLDGFPSLAAVTQWGVFSGGAALIACDNVASVDYRQQWALSDFPVEKGAFESYDKVATPFEARVRFTAGGSAANRQGLLDSIAAIAGDLNLYDVVTPEAVYSSVNITHYDYSRRADSGVGLISVDVWCLEVRVNTGAGSGSDSATPDGAGQAAGGSVQPGAATGSQTAAVAAIPHTPSLGVGHN